MRYILYKQYRRASNIRKVLFPTYVGDGAILAVIYRDDDQYKIKDGHCWIAKSGSVTLLDITALRNIFGPLEFENEYARILFEMCNQNARKKLVTPFIYEQFQNNAPTYVYAIYHNRVCSIPFAHLSNKIALNGSYLLRLYYNDAEKCYKDMHRYDVVLEKFKIYDDKIKVRFDYSYCKKLQSFLKPSDQDFAIIITCIRNGVKVMFDRYGLGINGKNHAVTMMKLQM